MRTEDFAGLYHIFADPNVMAAFSSPPLTRTQMQGWLQRNLDHQTTHGFGLFTVIRKDTHQLIGNCGLEVMAIEGETAVELGYDFRSDQWNQGYATEAASVVREFALCELAVPRLISLIRVGNDASRRVAEKVGMIRVNEYAVDNIRYWRYELIKD